MTNHTTVKQWNTSNITM